jgi:hypothetical protein
MNLGIKHNQKGFGTIETLLLIVIIILIGFAGWFVWHARHTDRTSTVTSATRTTKQATVNAASTITNGPGAEWQTYTNKLLGFSIQIPKEYMSGYGAMCDKVNYVYDNYGNKVPAAVSYVPAQGVVPATVIQMPGGDFYIAEAYTYQPLNKSSDGQGHELASECQKITTNSDVVSGYLESTPKYMISTLPFSVVKVSSQADITAWAKKKFDQTTYVVSTKENAQGWQDVTLGCTSGYLCFNFKYELRYYPSKNTLVYLQQGQSGHLQKPTGADFYDQAVFESFKLN